MRPAFPLTLKNFNWAIIKKFTLQLCNPKNMVALVGDDDFDTASLWGSSPATTKEFLKSPNVPLESKLYRIKYDRMKIDE